MLVTEAEGRMMASKCQTITSFAFIRRLGQEFGLMLVFAQEDVDLIGAQLHAFDRFAQLVKLQQQGRALPG